MRQSPEDDKQLCHVWWPFSVHCYDQRIKWLNSEHIGYVMDAAWLLQFAFNLPFH